MDNRMKRARWYGAVVLGVMVAVVGGGCGGAEPGTGTGAPVTYKGEEKPVGGGSGYSFVTLGADGVPTVVGITVTEEALTGLPPEEKKLFQFALPPEARMTVFDHIELRYWSHGHDPQELFAIEHFDVIPFMISQDERDKITAVGEDLEHVLRVPEPDKLPVGHAQIPPVDEFYAEPRYGTRYFDVENFLPVVMHEKPYTTTLFFGYYDAKVTFFEIPLTFPYLESHPDVSFPIVLPAAVDRHGYYPTQFSVRYDPDAKTYTLSLESMVYL